MDGNANLKMKPLERCPWLGKPVNKTRSAKKYKPSDECLTIFTKYFEEKLLNNSQKRVKILLLSNLSTKYFVES